MDFNRQYFENLQKIKKQDIEVLLKKAYRGIWETAIKKYSDSAHFVYELLQNADDAQATRVEFDLEEDGLWFKHNGRVRFSISNPKNEEKDTIEGNLGHINAITSIGNSAKIDDQKIGKFGIGFKAVFAYSNTPHIYDESICFKLEHYIVPKEIDETARKREENETLFYFPFDLPDKTKEAAYAEIEDKLKGLFQPILFLNHLKKIDWKSEGKQGGYAKKGVKTEHYDQIKASLVEVSETVDEETKKEHIWLFTSDIVNTENDKRYRIGVGFFVVDEKQLKTGYTYEAFCFFPTKEDTKLGFIIQAPFLLTDSREGIKANDAWNDSLVELIANLAAEAILILKKIGIKDKTFLINDSVLELVPYREADFSESASKARISFRPFYLAILKKFKTEKLLPGRKGAYYASEKAYWATDPDLAELFSDKQISELMENPNSGLVFVSKGQKQLNQANKALESYINSITKETVDPKKLLRKISANFIEAQSDEWLLRFYSYLIGRKSLWDDKDGVALKRPILLNQDRKAVVPFDDELEAPNVFLPTERPTSYDTIYKPFLSDKEALDFFKSLGIGKPDLRAEIFKTIIPMYDDDFDSDESETLITHFGLFLDYFEACPSSQLSDYIDKLREINFVASRDPGNKETLFFARPQSVYYNNEKINKYFEGCAGVYILDEEFYSEFLIAAKRDKFWRFMEALGLRTVPKVYEIKLEATTENKESFGVDGIEVSYGSRGEIYDTIMEGLENAMKDLTFEKSGIIWNFLLEQANGKSLASLDTYFRGRYYYFKKWGKWQSTEKIESTLSSLLRKEKWIFDKEGNVVSADELSVENLHNEYDTDNPNANNLIEFLGIEKDEIELDLTEEQKRALNFGQRLIEEGITKEELEEIISTITSRKRALEKKPDDEKRGYVKVQEEEIEEMLVKLKKGIRKNIKKEEKEQNEQFELKFEEVPEQQVDQDEFYKPSVDLEKKIDKLREQTELQIQDLTRIEKLNQIVVDSEIYSFAWFKALMELEYLSSAESNTQGKQLSIQFTKVEKEPGTERTLVLKHPNRYIPQSIEDIGDIQIRLFEGDEIKSVTVEVVSVKEYTLRAKLKISADIAEVDLSKVTRVLLEVKNPVFILEELRKAFYQLDLEDDFNLKDNITKKIRFIFGPPGTGKTTYLATDEIIPLMKRDENLKVLVLAPTNKSADVLVKRIMEKMGDDESYYHWLLRFGNTSDPELESSPIVVDKSFDIRTKPRNTTITTIARFSYDYFQTESGNERYHLKFLQWDYVVVDEASMVSLANIAYIIYQMRESSFIIAGDPFQIQPITQIDQWKDMNIYDMVKLDRFVDPLTEPHEFEIKNLKKQYRALPTIGNVFSHFTYDGIIEHHRTKEEQKRLNIQGLDIKDVTIVKFPVYKHESIYKPNTLNKSNYQIYSALFTVEFVKNFIHQIEKNNEETFRIGIICPYKAQATLIEKLISQQSFDIQKTELLVGTIHGFQGDECDIIFAIFNPPLFISKGQGMFLNKQNILNVSISRARDYLIILMPDEDTEQVENLYKIKKIEKLAHKLAKNEVAVYTSEEVEEILLGSGSYVYDNSFATTHQSVNVYSKPEKKYEIRCEETAIDVQIKAN